MLFTPFKRKMLDYVELLPYQLLLNFLAYLKTFMLTSIHLNVLPIIPLFLYNFNLFKIINYLSLVDLPKVLQILWRCFSVQQNGVVRWHLVDEEVTYRFLSKNPCFFKNINYILSSLRNIPFDGSATIDPYEHLKKFKDICLLRSPIEVSEGNKKLSQFLINLTRRDKDWLEVVSINVKNTWVEVEKLFRNNFIL